MSRRPGVPVSVSVSGLLLCCQLTGAGGTTRDICNIKQQKKIHMAQITEDGGNLEIFSALVFPEWSLCRGHIVVPGHQCRRQSNNIVHIS